MLATLLIVFREVIEAGLIVGIVLAATKGVARRGWWVGYGVAGGVAGACLVAAFAGEIATLFSGSGQELFNATILLLAVMHAHLAQCLDGGPWPRHGARNEKRRQSGCRRRTHARRRLPSSSAWRCCAKAPKSCCFSMASRARAARRRWRCSRAARSGSRPVRPCRR